MSLLRLTPDDLADLFGEDESDDMSDADNDGDHQRTSQQEIDFIDVDDPDRGSAVIVSSDRVGDVLFSADGGDGVVAEALAIVKRRESSSSSAKSTGAIKLVPTTEPVDPLAAGAIKKPAVCSSVTIFDQGEHKGTGNDNNNSNSNTGASSDGRDKGVIQPTAAAAAAAAALLPQSRLRMRSLASASQSQASRSVTHRAAFDDVDEGKLTQAVTSVRVSMTAKHDDGRGGGAERSGSDEDCRDSRLVDEGRKRDVSKRGMAVTAVERVGEAEEPMPGGKIDGGEQGDGDGRKELVEDVEESADRGEKRRSRGPKLIVINTGQVGQSVLRRGSTW